MQGLQAMLYELQPNGQQQRQMRRFGGCRRFVFNQALAFEEQRHEAGEKKLGYAGFCNRQVGTEPDDPGSRLVRVPAPVGLQAARKVWLSDRHTVPEQEPHL